MKKFFFISVLALTCLFISSIDFKVAFAIEAKYEKTLNISKNSSNLKHIKNMDLIDGKDYEMSFLRKEDIIESNIKLIPLGIPVGLKINTRGVIVVAMSDINTLENVKMSPAVSAGLQIGDVITHVNNIEINTGEEMSYYINSFNGNKVELTINRNGARMMLGVTPVQSSKDLKYKIGLWVRDYTAGVGMMTFVHKDTKVFGALGHPIADVDTNQVIDVLRGDIVEASIVSIRKGIKGYAGELKGIFADDKIVGKIDKNTKFGVFGLINNENEILNRKEFPIAFKEEIEEGPAKIIATIEGKEPREYIINIEKLLDPSDGSGKSMLIRITDQELLSKTDGIVQGMSGSPIIQNGKIVGAVTHVLLNKPEVGYGIYIESMLIESDIIKKYIY